MKLGIIAPYRKRPGHLRRFKDHLLEYLKDSFYDMSGELFDWTDGLLMLGFTMNAYYYLNDGEEKHLFYLSYQPSTDMIITSGGEKLISGVAYRISSPVEGYFRFEED